MNRYKDILLRKTVTGKRFQKTVKYPVIPNKYTDVYITGQIGDRLDNLAYRLYKDESLWWIIARANNIGKGDLLVPLGKQLRIPQDYISIVNEYKQLNK